MNICESITVQTKRVLHIFKNVNSAISLNRIFTDSSSDREEYSNILSEHKMYNMWFFAVSELIRTDIPVLRHNTRYCNLYVDN